MDDDDDDTTMSNSNGSIVDSNRQYLCSSLCIVVNAQQMSLIFQDNESTGNTSTADLNDSCKLPIGVAITSKR